jgi:dGTPase
MVEDVVLTSLKADLKRIVLSEEILAAVNELRNFLFEKVYLNDHALKEHAKTEKILTDLFDYITAHAQDYLKPYPAGDSPEKRAGDFIAGMTDRYALALYEKVFFPLSWPLER